MRYCMYVKIWMGGDDEEARKKAARNTAKGWAAADAAMYKPIKKPVTLRLDADLLAWFKAQGQGYQTRINQALRDVMARERKK